ncbi:beta-glucosidase [Pleomorphomonas sp. JP5]|uniref:beta-glucosidase family protein n=1 Tax=Pleomorphomonas sp. JP5 TaxID=2942998 RepID=UPI002043EFB4|nr:glycoside hydrolase family 3 C-terminal domain-containing protein [Pleomorphomonas sp. JP5]MCM5557007.1 glycoside hydrolase family 3 C-terminal domain-containing protein [Pleomorphomonas sp. JP5]
MPLNRHHTEAAPDAASSAPEALNQTFSQAVDRVRKGANPADEARALYARMTADERLSLLGGDQPFWEGMLSLVEDGYNVYPYVMGAVDRLGVPGVRFADGPRGSVLGRSTCFPVSMARGATWDVALEEKVGEVIGREIRALGANFFGGVCINLPRHPAWGRVQETYSDQPVILGEMGAALTRGIQHHAMACAKHYALNSMENARFSVDVTIAEADLQETFLPHFKRVIDEGAFAVMSSYNSVNGTWAGQNADLLTKTLRDTWHFDGFVITDFIWGMRDGGKALVAGLDVEAPMRQQRGERLPADLDSGKCSWADVERAGLRILKTQLRYYAERDAADPAPSVVASTDHVALAREAAGRAMVLLRNEKAGAAPVLPLDPNKLASLAVVGRLCDTPNTGDLGSSSVRAPYVVTPLAGLGKALEGTSVALKSDASGDPAKAAALAAKADAAVVVVGYTSADEGEFVDGSVATRADLLALYPEARNDAERTQRDKVLAALGGGTSVVGGGKAGGDRLSLGLLPEDVALIKAVAAVNPRTVVVIETAGAVIVHDWKDLVPAILIGWYAGMEGGHALADVLLGKRNPSGRLPYPIPADAKDTPFFDRDAKAITYDHWYSHRLMQKNGVTADFPLGFGLSYSAFRLSDMQVDPAGADSLKLRVSVANTGAMAGHHVVQVYGARTDGDRADERELLGFAVVELAAGERKTVEVAASLLPLGRWDAATRRIRVASGLVRVEAAGFWGDPDRLTATINVSGNVTGKIAGN